MVLIEKRWKTEVNYINFHFKEIYSDRLRKEVSISLKQMFWSLPIFGFYWLLFLPLCDIITYLLEGLMLKSYRTLLSGG